MVRVRHTRIWSQPNWSLLLALVILFGGIELGRTGSENGKENDGDLETLESNGGGNETKIKNRRNVTGIPQLDYVSDPNLPRELNGFNLSTYPFFSRVPTNINYSCEGLRDGFYSNVEHKCQVYHQCLFGTRYDFLCANYTAFDQRTFICQFVSEVDCANSADFFHRNIGLYEGRTTTTSVPVFAYGKRGNRAKIMPRLQASPNGAPPSPSLDPSVPNFYSNEASSTTTQNPALLMVEEPDDYGDDYGPVRPRGRGRQQQQRPCQRPRRRRPRWCRNRGGRRGRPRPYYYDDDYEDYSEDDYYDYGDYETETDGVKKGPAAGGKKKGGKKGGGGRKQPKQREEMQDYDYPAESKPGSKKSSTTSTQPPSQSQSQSQSPRSEKLREVPLAPLDPPTAPIPREELYTQSRAPPRIRPPVPKNKRTEYEMMQGRPAATSTTTTTIPTTTKPPPAYKNAKLQKYTHVTAFSPKTTKSAQQHTAPSAPSTGSSAPSTSSTGPDGQKQEYYEDDDYYTEGEEPSDSDYYHVPASDETSEAPTAAPLIQKKSNKNPNNNMRQQYVPRGSLRGTSASRGLVNRGSKTFPTLSPKTTTTSTTPMTTTTTTTTTTPKPEQIYEEYTDEEYEYYDDEPHPPSSSTTEKAKPSNHHEKHHGKGHRNDRVMDDHHDENEKGHSGPIAESSQNTNQETKYTGQRSLPELVGSYPSISSPNLEHIKIKEALEAPSKIPRLGRPYLNRPRPTLINNSMIQPVTSSSTTDQPSTTTTTTTTTSTTTTTTPRPTTTTATQRPRTTTTLPFKVMDGFNPRFPSYDGKQNQERPTRFWQRNTAQEQKVQQQQQQNHQQRRPENRPPPPPPSDMEEDDYYDEVMTTRYGQGGNHQLMASNHKNMDYGAMKLTGPSGSASMDEDIMEGESMEYREQENREIYPKKNNNPQVQSMSNNSKKKSSSSSSSSSQSQSHSQSEQMDQPQPNDYEMMNMANIEENPHLQRYGLQQNQRLVQHQHHQVPNEHEHNNFVTPFSSPSSSSSVSMSVSSSISGVGINRPVQNLHQNNHNTHRFNGHIASASSQSQSTTSRSPRLPSPEFISLLEDDHNSFYKAESPLDPLGNRRFRTNPKPMSLPMFTSSPDPFSAFASPVPTYSLSHFADGKNNRMKGKATVFPHFYSYFQKR